MKLNGTILRFFLLACFLIVVVVLAIVDFTNDDDLHVYLCDTESVMRECAGPDDVGTCADLGVDCTQSACGYQLADKIDISISGADSPFDEEGTATDATAGFMIFWSFVPYALFFFLVAAFLYAGDTASLSFLFLLGFIAIVNEVVFKHAISQHRPEGSCLYFNSYGMPSGHAATSIGTLWDMLLEIWVDRPASSLKKKSVLSVLALFFLVPVPYSRVYLHDHFGAQVGAGSAVGFAIASLWFLFMYKCARTRLDNWIDHACCKCFALRNTYRTSEPWLPSREELIENGRLAEGQPDDVQRMEEGRSGFVNMSSMARKN